MTNIFGSNVSRETSEKLLAFGELVRKWTSKVNLISKASVPELMDRHIRDSMQLFYHAPSGGHWADIGSGGGFPGIVIAILSTESEPERRMTLVESDQKKSAFLRTAIRELGLSANVITARIEEIEPLKVDILSARALAGLDSLLEFTERHLAQDGVALFLKGERWREEHMKAQLRWHYDLEVVKSETNDAAAVLKIKELVRV
ncbi:16S rRNA (guanine(527)-N(7))-methyltransferase RsmG [Sulfitobacter aestuarii]|uniref:Ribosomal RNA small subunit methyltransferase G n=1 Tax=Sulfitobacter aestuarii TaxID=2161676 RepID=A0ABW5U8V8_9RHOB